jgi:nicotinamide-nucleotide amidase
MPLETKVAQRLIKSHKTLSIAESCSGGLLAHRLTNIPGSSKFFKLGVIAYSYESKKQLLKIPAVIIKRYGAVSSHVVEMMAQNVQDLTKTDFGIGITGIAGPTGATRKKPIGLVYIALSTKNEVIVKRCVFKGRRTEVKKQTADQAMRMLLKKLG